MYCSWEETSYPCKNYPHKMTPSGFSRVCMLPFKQIPLLHSGTLLSHPTPLRSPCCYSHSFAFFSDTNVGVVSFSSSARTEIPFTSQQNIEMIKSSVGKMKYHGSSTRMDLGLQRTREEFSKQSEMRANMPDVLLAITDGKSNQGKKLFMSSRLDS